MYMVIIVDNDRQETGRKGRDWKQARRPRNMPLFTFSAIPDPVTPTLPTTSIVALACPLPTTIPGSQNA
ncbi:hypothetical protein M378DRAFT_157975 [Amanita muscaria Koide BX008]|uniref:Uncharacterized protein n=1 Tax=Amanita muscaria (strain Koide BX008) TaxID=946122 RepID=A0A0C2SZ58_AMAMK|nr:hypothetical protein M378DRAFT_157975 [Amanita muscaria Koide BX008]